MMYRNTGIISQTNYILQPAKVCSDQQNSVLGYFLTLQSSNEIINMSLAADETIALFGIQQGLEDNQKYVFTVTAFNNIGMGTARSTNETDNYLCK